MAQNVKDISFLITDSKYSDVKDFVFGCYIELLERPAGLNDILNACLLMDKGLTREGYIETILSSAEFAERFAVNDRDKYMAALNDYEEMQSGQPKRGKLSKNKLFSRPVKHSSEVNSKNTPEKVPQHFSVNFSLSTNCNKVDCVYQDPLSAEFDALNNCQMDSLRSFIESHTNNSSYLPIGHFSKDLYAQCSHDKESKIIADSDSIPSEMLSQDFDNLFVTSPGAVYSLLKMGQINKLLPHIRSSFIFTMPVLPCKDDDIMIIWDKHWHYYDINSEYKERYSSGSDSGSIYLVNPGDDTVKAHLSFELISFGDTSSIVICSGGQSHIVDMSSMLTYVEADMFLCPGQNVISFKYIGHPYFAPSVGGEPVRFALRNLKLQIPGRKSSIEGDSAYSYDTLTFGDGYYNYLLSDKKIRYLLHENGFYEVNCTRFYKNYLSSPESTTRYLEYRYGDQDINYHIYNEAPETSNDITSVRLYIANRYGTL